MLTRSKKCSRCGIEKPLESFDVRVSTKNGVVTKAWCMSCETPPKAYFQDPVKRKQYQTLKRYGLTVEEVNEMGEAQGWLCYLCPTDISEKYYIDHDHKTGKVRKLLCMSCNVALGHFHDSIPLLEKAIAYLQEHNTSSR